MVCPYCHREVADGTLYCIFCGKKLCEEAAEVPFEQTQEKSDFDYEPTQEVPAVVTQPLPVNPAAPMPAEITQLCCPDCGSRDFQVVMKNNTTTTVNTKTKGYSASKGCLGYLFLGGPLGLLCGACGSGKSKTTATTTVTNEKSFVCKNCGCEFRSPKDLEGEIAALEAAVPRKKLMGKILIGIFGLAGLIDLICLFIALSNTWFFSGDAIVGPLVMLVLDIPLLAMGFALNGSWAEKEVNEKKAEYQDLKERMARFQ